MRIAVMQFPGTNCEYETLVAVKEAGMDGEIFRWNRPEQELYTFDGFVIPGGFSYQDRVRAGVIASKEPVLSALKEEAIAGKPIIGICNGFQILVESGILPMGRGVDLALAQNVMIQGGRIVRRGYYCAWTNLRHDANSGRCSGSLLMNRGAILQIPIAHAEGNLVAGKLDIIERLIDEDQVVFRYCDPSGDTNPEFPVNVNGSTDNIAGICNPEGNVLGMMPHPERAAFTWQLPPGHYLKDRANQPGPGILIFRSMKRFIEVAR